MRFSFGKFKNYKVEEVVAEDPAYIAFLMWGCDWFQVLPMYKEMLAAGYDRIPPRVGFGRMKGKSIADIKREDPNYFLWIVGNKPLREKCRALDEWIRVHGSSGLYESDPSRPEWSDKPIPAAVVPPDETDESEGEIPDARYDPEEDDF